MPAGSARSQCRRPRISAGLHRRLTAALTLLCGNLIPPHAPRLHPRHAALEHTIAIAACVQPLRCEQPKERKPFRTLDTLVPNVHIPPQPTPLNARAGKSSPYRPFPQLSTLAHHQLGLRTVTRLSSKNFTGHPYPTVYGFTG
ncbi:hypothetical protein B0H14DRAFT_3892912 [Mycena olivaceomarginata]|nr:hypothetical protein B0H14DRAFT_3892912 [Mycena olivaceomarginata]